MSRVTLPEPIPIAKFFKSARDRTRHVRVELSEYEGHALINVRVWQTGTDGIDRPTKQGIALAIRKLPTLTVALLKAEDKARELGLIKADESEAVS
jgi:transcriptional coactivator p15 (PC4)